MTLNLLTQINLQLHLNEMFCNDETFLLMAGTTIFQDIHTYIHISLQKYFFNNVKT